MVTVILPNCRGIVRQRSACIILHHLTLTRTRQTAAGVTTHTVNHRTYAHVRAVNVI